MRDQRSRDYGLHHRPVVSRIVEGDSLCLEGRELVPLIRMTGRVKRQAALHEDGASAQGHGVVHMRPLALVHRGEDCEHRYQVRDQTASALRRLALAALLIPWLSALLVHLSGRLAGQDS